MASNNGQQTQTTALATTGPAVALQRFLNPRLKALEAYATGRTKPDVLVRLACYEFANSDWLQKCSLDSVYASLITAAQLGLEPGAAKGEGYLVPFKGKCQFIPGYRGLIKLALRSKAVKSVYAHVVFEHDTFMLDLGSEPRAVHQPNLDGERGEIRGVYAVAQLVSGAIDVEWMGIKELEKIRADAAKARGGHDGPYKDHTAEMYRKAAIRRLAKRLPLGDDFFQATHVDELAEVGKDAPRFDAGGLPTVGSDPVDADVVEQPGLAGKVARAAQQAQRDPDDERNGR